MPPAPPPSPAKGLPPAPAAGGERGDETEPEPSPAFWRAVAREAFMDAFCGGNRCHSARTSADSSKHKRTHARLQLDSLLVRGDSLAVPAKREVGVTGEGPELDSQLPRASS